MEEIMPLSPRGRLHRERHTIRVMIEIYCRGNHHPAEAMCGDCQALVTYAMQRVDKCPFQADKPTCAKCPIHCYKPDMRERIRAVMRYAGPRMVWRHPVLAAFHLIDARRKALLAAAPKPGWEITLDN